MNAKSVSTPAEADARSFWFRPVSAVGFGLMRIGFGLSALVTMILQWPNIDRYFGPAGIVTQEMIPSIVRWHWRFSILDTVSLQTMHVLFLVLLVALVFVILGFWTRISLFISLVLLYSFHEYGTYTLDGGDTLLRLIGFILLLAPSGRAMTVPNLWNRIRIARETGSDQKPEVRTMPIWPYRLLLWQVTVMYISSVIEKLSGHTWISGSAVAIALHHRSFSRLPAAWADAMSHFSPAIGYFTLLTQSAWALPIILPCFVWLRILPASVPGSVKRALLLAGFCIHGGIFLLMDVGTFSFTVFAAYLGLLLEEDFRAIRHRLNGDKRTPEVVLFDGRCGFCKASVIVLKSFNWLRRLRFENMYDPKARAAFAPSVPLKTLKTAMHVRSSNGAISKGFRAFRALAWHLPPMWILVPFLYIPGVPMIGERTYQWIANHRM